MSQAPPSGERRLVTVLFADLTGFTALSEGLDPEDIQAFLGPVMDELSAVIDAHGGTVVKWMGDGLMAVFGVPVTHSDDAERAIRAAIACREAVRARAGSDAAWTGPANLHAGIQTGEVLVLPVRDGIDVIGDTVNTAARLVGVAPAGCVLVGPRTRELAERAAGYLEWAPIRLKGKAEAVQAFQVTSVASTPAGRPARAGRTPFVGRERALSWLEAHLDEAVEKRESRVVLVAGPQGVGKSRLVERFNETHGAPRQLLGRCAAYGERAPWHAIADALRSHLGLAAGAEAEEARTALGTAVGRVLPELGDRERAALAGWLSTVLGHGGPAPPPADRQLNLDLAVAVRRFLSALAGHGALVVVLEELQWADPQVLSFLSWTVEEPWPAPVLFLCVGWPELLERGEPKLPDASVLRLEPLTEAECTSMLDGLLPGAMPADVRAELMRRSGGNPLYLEETVHLLRERGALSEADGAWTLSGDAAAIPETVQLVVAARIDGLPEDERRLLRDASVVGELFWDRVLRALGWGPDVEEVLERLAGRDLVRAAPERLDVPDARAYAFKHPLIRDVAYGTLPRAERAAKHLAVAGWLKASVFAGEEPVDLLAAHYSAAVALQPNPPARVVRMAVDAVKRAGDRARGQFAWVDADARYAHALSLGEGLDADPSHVDGELLAETRLAHAETLANLSRYDEARSEAAAILELAAAADRPDWHARALLVLGWVESDVPNEERARELLRRAIEIARQHGDPRSEAIANYEMAFTWRFEDPERSQEWLAKAADGFEAVGDRAWEFRSMQDLAWMLTPHGEERFGPAFERLRGLTEERADPRAAGALHRAEGFARFFAGDLSAARTALEEAVAAGRDTGDPDIEIESRYPLALIDLAEGRLDAADAHADRMREAGERRGFRRIVAMALLVRARADARRGAHDRAAAALERAEQLLEELRAQVDLVEVHAAAAEIALDRGDHEAAETNARRFTEALRTAGPLWRPYGLALSGMARLGAGDLAGARAAFEEAVAEGTGIGNVLAPVRAGVALAQIDALEGREPWDLPPLADLPTPVERAMAAETRAIRGDAEAWAEAAAAWRELGVTAWTERSGRLASAFERG